MGNRWSMNLAGKWDLFLENGKKIQGELPGCTYLALMENQCIPDPFWGSNEQEAMKLAEQEYRYKRSFVLKKEDLCQDTVELVLDGVDTLAVIRINGKPAGKTANAFRTWRLAVKEYLAEGSNEIEIDFEAPHGMMRSLQGRRPLAGMDIGIPGVSYIRKPQYHFGWDWGPGLPPAGISGKIMLEGYSCARLDNFKVSQKHESGKVSLTVCASYKGYQTNERMALVWSVLSPEGVYPDGCFYRKVDFENEQAEDTIQIPDPQLWWCNGMGKQPLYTVEAVLRTESGEIADTKICQIGLRRLELNQSANKWGDNFQFRINGEPVFAKGANWIPADSFTDRVTEEKLEFYIRSAKEANMNMLRVWGGGYYETDCFYKLCDKYGILVWQDFAFACRAYPLDEPEFLENVRAEVADQVQRLQSHACLALWCGNNELQLEELLWAGDRSLRKAIHTFFFETLPGWIREMDTDTPYWYGSPSDKVPGKRANTLDCGDTHLWQIWHGLMPITAFRHFPTRFCSEFGLESLPSKSALAAFTDVEKATLQSKDMLQHQKAARGNEKLLYYVTLRHPRPADMDSTIYLTQIMQAEGIRSAVEFWHKNRGRCNGALYWQYNDCWPAVSWSGIDYLGQYKALQYWAGDFYAPVSITAETKGKQIQVQVINDRRTALRGSLLWKSFRLDGTQLSCGSTEIRVDKASVSKAILLRRKEVLRGERPENAVVSFFLLEGKHTAARRNLLFVPEKKARFVKPAFDTGVEVSGKQGRLTLQADGFARYVFISLEGISMNFSDNFFDLEKGEKREISFELPEEMDEQEIRRRLRVRSYADFAVVHTPIRDMWMRFKIRWSFKGIKGRLMTQI